LPIRDDLRGLTPYGAPQLDVAIRLNTNENAYPMPEPVARAMARALAAELTGLNRYPERDAVALRADLAVHLGHGLGVDNIWVANGSNEIQQQLLQVFGGPGRTAMGFSPSYSMHRLLALGTATGWIDGERGADFDLTPRSAADQVRANAPDVVFLCSPNNPTGTALPPAVLEAVLDAATGIVVVDEAYAEFARPGTPTALARLDGHPRLVVTRTMSKAFACAGVRVGYLAAAPDVIDAVQLVRLPYHLSSLTQVAARVALAHGSDLLATVEAIKAGRDLLVQELRALGLRVVDSDANFVLLGRGAGRLAAGHRRYTRGERGIPGRDGRRPGGIVSRTARVERKTGETSVLVELDLDGTGTAKIGTGIGFFDHMLAQIARHGGIDLTVSAVGDLDVDAHHTIEDTALALGTAFAAALGDKSGIRRYGHALIPLDEVLVQAAVDLSGRPYVVHDEPALAPYIGPVYPTSMTRHIWESFGHAARVTLHVSVLRAGRPGGTPDAHHVVEAQFKAVARALREAVCHDPRGAGTGVPSTKGVL
jgi:histidinol-phosphate aminotransferase